MENFGMKLSGENELLSKNEEIASNKNIENKNVTNLTNLSISNEVNELINDDTNTVDEQQFPYNMLGESLW